MTIRPKSPAWVDNAVFYEIYPQTFCDSNGDGIGDLPGIISKLDYVKSLGVNAIWLNPCYVSPMRDAGYDVADYCRVDPRYGTNVGMKKLFREAKKRGLRVILDFVPGHTSIDHPWFKASCENKRPYKNWYIWTNSTWDFGGKKWRGKMIHGYCERNGNFMTNFFWSQPALNFGFAKPEEPWQLPVDHPDVRKLRAEVKRILRFWLDMGASGFRVDMAGSLIRNDPGAKEIIRFWQEIRTMLDRDYPDAFMVSEWSGPVHALKAGFHADFLHWFRQYNDLFRKESWRILNGMSDGHSYFDKEGKGDISRFLEVYTSLLKKTRRDGYISIPVGNHDLARINVKRTSRDLEIITAFLLTIPGVPFLYYGDEIGMRQLGSDLPNREGSYTPRKGARTPMQWDHSKNMGFSSGSAKDLYLPMDSSRSAPTVADQQNNPRSLLNRTRTLIELRRTEPALAAYADFVPLHARTGRYPLVFMRKNGKERVVVALNPSGRKTAVTVDAPIRKNRLAMIAGGGGEARVVGERLRVVMEGCSFGVWRV